MTNAAADPVSNPLLDFSGLTRFDEIKPEHIKPAIDTLLQRCRSVVARLQAPEPQVTWTSFVEPLENVTEELGRAWSVIGHLNAVVDTPALRAAYNDNQARVVAFWTELAQDQALFEKYRALKASSDFPDSSRAQRAVVEHALRDFRLGGAELEADKKQRFAAIQEQQAALTTRFSENILDATNDFELLIEDETELSGLPDDVKQAARLAAQQDSHTGFKFTLHFPSYFPVLQYADRRALREQIYHANATRASDLGSDFSRPQDWDNTQNMADILKLRHEEAVLLGFNNFAELSLEAKMASSPAEVIDFLQDLAQRARPFAEKDIAELRAFAHQELGLQQLEAWDITYASEKLRQQRYAFSEQEVKQYFPESKVIAGLFDTAQKLFSITIKPDLAPVWHKDVKFFRIERQTTQGNHLIAQFYLDLYARNGKRGGAWMDDARAHRRTPDGVQTPIAYLTCNFSPPPVRDGQLQAATFTHDEVITLFH